MEYASRAVGNTGLGLGIAGSALGLLNGAGGLLNLFGGQPRPPGDPGEKPVTRYEMGLWQDINAKNVEIAQLKGERYTDGVAAGLQAQLSQQAVYNATQKGVLDLIGQQVLDLQAMTKTFIPLSSIALPATSGDVATAGTTSGT